MLIMYLHGKFHLRVAIKLPCCYYTSHKNATCTQTVQFSKTCYKQPFQDPQVSAIHDPLTPYVHTSALLLLLFIVANYKAWHLDSPPSVYHSELLP
jgi:hypothetical protein